MKRIRLAVLTLPQAAPAQSNAAKPVRFIMLVGSTPAQLDAHVKSEITPWAKVVRDSGARIN